MPRFLQAATLVVVLALFFQCDPDFRAWQREALHQVFHPSPSPSSAAQGNSDSAREHESPDRPNRPRDDPWQGDSPKSPLMTDRSEFPGPGWYRVKRWRGWFPEKLFQCLETSHRHIATEDEWWDMAWGRWETDAGAEVAADARMYTTNGIRLEAPPEGSTASLARN
jgi:hypothetical protein